ncbi:MAG: DinB family protein [Acidobacteriota bacterium]
MQDTNFRNNLIELLQGGQAHASTEQAVSGMNPKFANARPTGLPHSVWEVLEHMRIAQEDILRYTLDPNWQSPPFPEGYWPTNIVKMTEKDWSDSLKNFFTDLDQVIKLVKNPGLDLTSEIPHGEGRTYLREILLVADHNSYHTAEIIQIRKALGQW